MKKIKILLIMLLAFTINSKANAQASISVSKNEVYVGDTFTVNVNMSATAAWEIHVTATGPVSGCTINQADATADALDTSKTFSANCTATGVGNIVITLTGNTTSANGDGNAVDVSGSANVKVNEKPQETPVTPPTPTTPSTPTVNTPPAQKNNDATLKNIELSNGTIEFSNDKDTYDVSVGYDIPSIEVKGILNDNKASVKLEGDTNLKEGENIIKLIVTAEDGTTTKTYTLNIKRENKILSKNNNIKKLTINNYDINFNKNKKEYDLIINNEDNLTINVELEDEFAKYDILGNKKLKNKSVIKIKVTAEDNSVKEYKINIIKEVNKTKELKLALTLSIILNSIIIVLLIFIVIRLNNNHKEVLRDLFKFTKKQ